jgi:hypothetical protein
MAASVSLHDPVKSLQRDLVQLLLKSIEEVDARDQPLATRVHELRKRLKRARAWAQILPKPLARSADRALRDIHQRLGARRDQDATLEAIARLLATARDGDRTLAIAGLQALREALRRQRDDAADAAADSTGSTGSIEQDVAAARQDLARLAQLIESAALDGDFRVIAESAADTARRSRKAMRRALRSGQPHDYHRWRKWMKYHWFHLRYLAPLWPDLLRVEADAAEHAAEALGQSQDIELVRQALEATALPPGPLHAVNMLIDREQQHLMRAAASIGLHIHAESPAAFARRLRNYGAARLHRTQPMPSG